MTSILNKTHKKAAVLQNMVMRLYQVDKSGMTGSAMCDIQEVFLLRSQLFWWSHKKLQRKKLRLIKSKNIIKSLHGSCWGLLGWLGRCLFVVVTVKGNWGDGVGFGSTKFTNINMKMIISSKIFTFIKTFIFHLNFRQLLLFYHARAYQAMIIRLIFHIYLYLSWQITHFSLESGEILMEVEKRP